MTDATSKDEIEKLKKEVAAMKAALAPTPNDAAAIGAWRDSMHQLSEARASVSGFSRADLEEFERACPTNVARAIACRDNRAPSGPSSQGAIPSSQQISNVRSGGSPGGTGWAREVPLGPPSGIGYVDMLCEVDAARQRGERMVEEAKRKAAEKAE
jgi:hypothetical protein